MIAWNEFASTAPEIAQTFVRRHGAAGNLCLLATVRADGSPRISPMEPRVVGGQLVMVGMPNTTKFRDLARDPRFCLHTATVDPHLGDGDVKLFGRAHNLQEEALHQKFAEDLLAESGMDLREERFDPFYVADLTGASSIELEDNELKITIWKPGEGQRVVRKT